MVFFLAIGAQTEWLIFDGFLLLSCQEESLASQLSNEMNQTNSVVNVIAVQESYVFVSDQHILFAQLAILWHLLLVLSIKFILKNGERLCLYFYLLLSWFRIFNQEYENVFAFQIQTAFLF